MAIRRRPGGVTAIAIINIVLASLGLLLGICAGIVMLAGQGLLQADPNQAAMQNFIEKEVPGSQVMNIAGMVILFLQAIVFLAAGIGLINMQNWARTTTITFSFLSIVWLIFQAFYTFAFTAPAMNRFFRDFGAVGPGPNPRAIFTIGLIVQALLWVILIIYAIIVIVVLTRPHVREAFTADVLEGDRERFEDERTLTDDDWYENRRRRDGEDS